MAKIVFVFAACLAFASAARLQRDAPQQSPLDEVSKHAEEFSKTFNEQFTKLTSSKNTEEFNKALKENTDTLLDSITKFSSSLSQVIADTNGKAKDAFSDAAAKLQQTVEDLKKQNPQVEQQAKELGDKIKAAVQNTVEETNKLAKQVSTNAQELGDKVAPTVKDAYDNFVKQAEEVQKKLHEAASKN